MLIDAIYKSSLFRSASLNVFFFFSHPGEMERVESKNAGDADSKMPDLASDNDDG